MQQVLKNILFPVNLTDDTESHLAKAIALANQLECNLHLIYTGQSGNRFTRFFQSKNSNRSLERKKKILAKLGNKYADKMSPGSSMITVFPEDTPGKEWLNYTLTHPIDMLYLDNLTIKQRHSLLLAHELTKSVTCFLFAGRCQPGLAKVEKIVLPIGEYLPVNRIRVTVFLAHHLGASIHLVSNGNTGTCEKNSAYLRKAYQLLRENTNLVLTYTTYPGSDLEHSTREYARSVNAGLIVTKNHLRPLNFFQKLFPPHRDEISLVMVEN